MVTKKELADFIRSNLSDDDVIALVVEKKEKEKERRADPAPSVTRVVTSSVSTEQLVLKALSSGASSASGIAAQLDIRPSTVSRTIKKLKAGGTVFQGGERRFARYGLTQAEADASSEAARS